MKIFVSAKTGAKKCNVEKIDGAHFKVTVKEPPQKGRANAAIAKALADYFGIAPSRMHLARGKTSKKKTFEIF